MTAHAATQSAPWACMVGAAAVDNDVATGEAVVWLAESARATSEPAAAGAAVVLVVKPDGAEVMGKPRESQLWALPLACADTGTTVGKPC